MKKCFQLLLPLVLSLGLLLGGCGVQAPPSSAAAPQSSSAVVQAAEPAASAAPADSVSTPALAESPEEEPGVQEDGEYISKEEVAEYLYLYAHLPGNFITKKEAQALGWESSKGNLGQVAPGKSIGGDYFGNYEGLLPEAPGREYHECDIDSTGGYRGAKRIVYSNDGLIYYTEDHYEHFELLYGEEG